MSEDTPSAPAAATAPKAATRKVDPKIEAVREDRRQQAKVSTRFDADKFRRKEYAADGATVVPRPRRKK